MVQGQLQSLTECWGGRLCSAGAVTPAWDSCVAGSAKGAETQPPPHPALHPGRDPWEVWAQASWQTCSKSTCTPGQWEQSRKLVRTPHTQQTTHTRGHGDGPHKLRARETGCGRAGGVRSPEGPEQAGAG